MSISDLREELNFPKPPGFPPEVREVFGALRDEVTFLHGVWDIYAQLYGTEDAVAALNGTAPGAFSFLGYVLRHDLFMTICRITDPKQTGKKENLTLDRLLHVITHQPADPRLVSKLEEQLKEINSACEPFRVRRNRTLGHLDLETALRTHPEPLPAIERVQIMNVLDRIARFMNEVLSHYTAAHADFVPLISGPARNIVHGLREFQRLRKLEYERQIAELRGDSGNVSPGS
jgi:AbiU2